MSADQKKEVSFRNYFSYLSQLNADNVKTLTPKEYFIAGSEPSEWLEIKKDGDDNKKVLDYIRFGKKLRINEFWKDVDYLYNKYSDPSELCEQLFAMKNCFIGVSMSQPVGAIMDDFNYGSKDYGKIVKNEIYYLSYAYHEISILKDLHEEKINKVKKLPDSFAIMQEYNFIKTFLSGLYIEIYSLYKDYFDIKDCEPINSNIPEFDDSGKVIPNTAPESSYNSPDFDSIWEQFFLHIAILRGIAWDCVVRILNENAKQVRVNQVLIPNRDVKEYEKHVEADTSFAANITKLFRMLWWRGSEGYLLVDALKMWDSL